MAMFDILDDMVSREVTKTETGDTKMDGIAVGTVTKNYDENMKGRVCVSIATRDENANEMKWARVASPWGGSGYGQFFLPEVGDLVLLAFEGGSIERPYVIGSLYKDSDEILTGSVDENNQYKKIVSKHGNALSFEDNQEGDGTKDKVKIQTAGEVYSLQLDNENNKVTLSDKEGKNLIEMDTKEGKMQLTAEKGLSIKVGSSVELSLDGDSGEISIKGTKLTGDLNSEVSLSGKSTLKLTSGNLSADATGSLKLSSSGAVTVSGTPIKIG